MNSGNSMTFNFSPFMAGKPMDVGNAILAMTFLAVGIWYLPAGFFQNIAMAILVCVLSWSAGRRRKVTISDDQVVVEDYYLRWRFQITSTRMTDVVAVGGGQMGAPFVVLVLADYGAQVIKAPGSQASAIAAPIRAALLTRIDHKED